MKKTLLLIGFILLMVSAYAQTGLFGIKFGAPADSTITMLQKQGLAIVSREATKVNFNGGKVPNLKGLSLYLSSDSTSVNSWNLAYDLSAGPEAGEAVIEALGELHGAYDVLEDYDYDYIWYFPNDKALYVSMFSDSMLLEYTSGNWDDDDYYYYEDW